MLLSDTKRHDEAVGELMAAAQLADEQYRLTKVAEDREEAKQVLHRAYWRLGVVQTRREQAADAIVALEKAKALQALPEVLTILGSLVASKETSFGPRRSSALRWLKMEIYTRRDCTWRRRWPAPVAATMPSASFRYCSSEPQLAETTNRIKQRCDYDRQMKARGQAPK